MAVLDEVRVAVKYQCSFGQKRLVSVVLREGF